MAKPSFHLTCTGSAGRMLPGLALAALLAACGNEAATTPDSQVAVRINKSDISVHQIQAVMQRQPRMLAEQPETAAARVLDILVEQELAAQAARDQGLDRDPAIVQALEVSRREVLARAYQDQIASKATGPTSEEIDRYYDSRPEVFGQRRLYTLKETVVEATPEQAAKVQELAKQARNGDELNTLLTSAALRNRTRQFVQAAEGRAAVGADAAGQARDRAVAGGAASAGRARVHRRACDAGAGGPPHRRRRDCLLSHQRAQACAGGAVDEGLAHGRHHHLPGRLRQAGGLGRRGAFRTAMTAREASGIPAAAGPAAARGWWPAGSDAVSVWLVVAGLVLLYGPTFWDWSRGLWGAETQGHELLILALSAWLVFDKRHRLAALDSAPAPRTGSAVLALGLLMYLFGRTQEAVRVELLSLDVVAVGLLLRFKGWAAVRLVWFALVFLLFAMPLPFSVSQALTAPMKSAVSAVAAQLLHWLGYPIGRSGVVITGLRIQSAGRFMGRRRWVCQRRRRPRGSSPGP